MIGYSEFIDTKRILFSPRGLDQIDTINPGLYEWQADIVRWALHRGQACIFAECGLGKTIMQLEWARQIPGRVLILAPLAVATQTVDEGARFGIEARYLRADDGKPGIIVTNYEMMRYFDPADFEGVVLDESSILKAHDGKTRTAILEAFSATPFRLACTATPAPNDHIELGNHAEFVGAMTRAEMLAMFFVHDGGSTQNWRLKGHARESFWSWMASWAVMIKTPADLGYDGSAFDLPPLSVHHHILDVAEPLPGQLFADTAKTLQDQRAAARMSIPERVAQTAALVNGGPEPWVVWCNLNDESAALSKAIPGAVEVKGADPLDVKESRLRAFSRGEVRVLVSKPSIAGWGLNWQHCSNVVFAGLSHSWESYYQAIRRCWRFGQTRPVDVHVIVSDGELEILRNIRRKEKEANAMSEEMTRRVSVHTDLKSMEPVEAADYEEDVAHGEGWKMMLGDCVERTTEIKTDSVHFTVFSPPFASLYTYTNSLRDMGNCRTDKEFADHFRFLCGELLRVTMPGRLLSFHCMNLPTSKVRDGVIGLRDFRGELIQMFSEAGWIYHSEVCIWKDPVTAMQRTKALGLLHKQLRKDACMSRQGIADYLVTMRKPGENPERVANDHETFPVKHWQNYASPIWTDIRPNDTLQYRSAREHDDERHICPLQLSVIRRAIRLWTNPGDLVYSPFAGIGSEGFVAVGMERRFCGVELKRSYWASAVQNLKRAEQELKTGTLFGSTVTK